MELVQIYLTWQIYSNSWIRIRILNAYPDPKLGGKMNTDPCGSGSTALLIRLENGTGLGVVVVVGL